jgi:DNA polymerase III delta prime subunit
VKNEPLNHLEAIKSLLITIRASDRMHALIIQGPPGWGKTTTVDEALKAAGVNGMHLGSYSTPLHLFNFLHDNSRNTVVIDDCAGLFSDQSSMAILKAATWGQGKQRKIRWGSTSGKASAEEFYFEGKLIIVCNSFPTTADAEAVKSRSFPYKINIDPTRACPQFG